MGSISSVMWTSPYNNLWYYCFEYTHNFTLHQTTWKLKLNVDGQNTGEPNKRWGECKLYINGALMADITKKQLQANSLLAQGIISNVPNSSGNGSFKISLNGWIHSPNCSRTIASRTVQVTSSTDYPNGANVCFKQYNPWGPSPEHRDKQDRVQISVKYPPSGRNCSTAHSMLFWTSNNKQPWDIQPYTYHIHSHAGSSSDGTTSLIIKDGGYSQWWTLYPSNDPDWNGKGWTKLDDICNYVYAVNYRNTSCGINNIPSVGGHVGHWYYKYPDPVDRTTVEYFPVNEDDYIKDTRGNIIGLPLDCPMRIKWKAPKPGNDVSPITKYRIRFCRIPQDIDESLYAQVFAAYLEANENNGYVTEEKANYLAPVQMSSLTKLDTTEANSMSDADKRFWSSLIDYPAPTPDSDGYVYFDFIPEDLGFNEGDLFFMGIYSCCVCDYDRELFNGHGWTISQVWCPLSDYRLMSGGKMCVKTGVNEWKTGRTYVKDNDKWSRAVEVFVKTYDDYIISANGPTEWKISPTIDEINKQISFNLSIRRADSASTFTGGEFNVKINVLDQNGNTLGSHKGTYGIAYSNIDTTDWMSLGSDNLFNISYEGDIPPLYKLQFQATSTSGGAPTGSVNQLTTSDLYPMWVESL